MLSVDDICINSWKPSPFYKFNFDISHQPGLTIKLRTKKHTNTEDSYVYNSQLFVLYF